MCERSTTIIPGLLRSKNELEAELLTSQEELRSLRRFLKASEEELERLKKILKSSEEESERMKTKLKLSEDISKRKTRYMIASWVVFVLGVLYYVLD